MPYLEVSQSLAEDREQKSEIQVVLETLFDECAGIISADSLHVANVSADTTLPFQSAREPICTVTSNEQRSIDVLEESLKGKLYTVEETVQVTCLLIELSESACHAKPESASSYQRPRSSGESSTLGSTLLKTRPDNHALNPDQEFASFEKVKSFSFESTRQITTFKAETSSQFMHVFTRDLHEPCWVDAEEGTLNEGIVELVRDLTDIVCRDEGDRCVFIPRDDDSTSIDDIVILVDSISRDACSDVPMLPRLLSRRKLSYGQWQREVEDSCTIQSFSPRVVDKPTHYGGVDWNSQDTRKQNELADITFADKHERMTLPLSQKRVFFGATKDINTATEQLDLDSTQFFKESSSIDLRKRYCPTPELQKPRSWDELRRASVRNMSNSSRTLAVSPRLDENSIQHEPDRHIERPEVDPVCTHANKRRKWQPPKVVPRSHHLDPRSEVDSLTSPNPPKVVGSREHVRRDPRRGLPQFMIPRTVPHAELVVQWTGCADRDGPSDSRLQAKASRSMNDVPSCMQHFKSVMRFNDSSSETAQDGPVSMAKARTMPITVESGWSTAAGAALKEIPRDARLAAEWQTPTQQPCSDVDESMIAEKIRLQERLGQLKKDLKAIELAYKVETQQEDSRLSTLIEKWRSVSQKACSDMHATISVRLSGRGDIAGWKHLRQETGYCSGPSAMTHRSGQDDFALTLEEAELMGITEDRPTSDLREDGYTMSHLLAQFNIPHEIVQWDPESSDWY